MPARCRPHPETRTRLPANRSGVPDRTGLSRSQADGPSTDTPVMDVVAGAEALARAKDADNLLWSSNKDSEQHRQGRNRAVAEALSAGISRSRSPTNSGADHGRRADGGRGDPRPCSLPGLGRRPAPELDPNGRGSWPGPRCRSIARLQDVGHGADRPAERRPDRRTLVQARPDRHRRIAARLIDGRTTVHPRL